MKKSFAALCALILGLALAAPLRAQDTKPAGDIKEISIEDETHGISYPEYTGKASDAVRAKINAALAAPLQQLGDLANDPELDPPSLYLDFDVTRKTAGFLSVVYHGSYMHPGAAHPANPMFGVTLDLKTGGALALADLFRKDCDYKAALLKQARQWIAGTGEELALFKPLDDLGLNDPDPWNRPGFHITEQALVIFYQEYVYTPHAYGPLVMDIPIKGLSECIKKEFMPGQ